MLNGNWYSRGGERNDLNWININKSHLVEGENTIYVIDKAGNKSEDLIFFFDITAPIISIKEGAIGSDGRYSKIDLKIIDNSENLEKCVVNGKDWSATNNKWGRDLNGHSWWQKEGENTVICYDLAGNASEEFTFIFDTTPPVVELVTTYTDKDGVTHNQVPLEKDFVNASDNVRVKTEVGATVYVEKDGEVVASFVWDGKG